MFPSHVLTRPHRDLDTLKWWWLFLFQLKFRCFFPLVMCVCVCVCRMERTACGSTQCKRIQSKRNKSTSIQIVSIYLRNSLYHWNIAVCHFHACAFAAHRTLIRTGQDEHINIRVLFIWFFISIVALRKWHASASQCCHKSRSALVASVWICTRIM